MSRVTCDLKLLWCSGNLSCARCGALDYLDYKSDLYSVLFASVYLSSPAVLVISVRDYYRCTITCCGIRRNGWLLLADTPRDIGRDHRAIRSKGKMAPSGKKKPYFGLTGGRLTAALTVSLPCSSSSL